MANDIDYRLSKSVIPDRYEITIRPDFTSLTFTGHAAVTVDIKETVDEIVMNALDLTIQEAYILADQVSLADADANFDEYSPLHCSWRHDANEERVAIISPVDLEAGLYTLVYSFSGVLNDKLRGFYKSVYTDDGGEKHVIATTQFEQTDARRAFPCFDEPDFKAVFSIVLEVPEEMAAFSNSKEISSEPIENGYKRVAFADTIKMSTYLVAFIVGELKATPCRKVRDTDVRVICTPSKLHLTEIALDVAEHAIKYFEDYFAIPYPGDKLDLVAIPDFAAGAMETLGCVTFRKAILLADPNRASRPELERLSEVVEHELAHMWFGDLVTMKWWNGIWLNEAFATFMSLKCQADFRPEWRPFDAFARERAAALSVDGLHGTRPIEIEVRHPDDAAAMFDVLTYEKGASVLWMIEQYLGENNFRAGIRNYLQLHKLANTETHDLWDALEAEAENVPVRDIMNSFIFQGGFPLLTVKAGDTAQSPNSAVEITQEPFSYLAESDILPMSSLLGNAEDGKKYSGIGDAWLVPATVIASKNLSLPPLKAVIGNKAYQMGTDNTLVIANNKGTGYYRVRYDRTLENSAFTHWEFLSPSEKFCLVSDIWNLVVAKKTDLSSFIGLLKSLDKESDPHVWSVVIGALSLLSHICSERDREDLKNFICSLLAPQLDKIGRERKPEEGDDTSLLRASLLVALANLGEDTKTLEYGRKIFEAERAGEAEPDPDIFSGVLDIIAAHATPEEFDSLLKRALDPIDPLDQKRHLNALARIRDLGYAEKLYGLSLDAIRSQDAPFLLGALLSSRELGVRTWKFISENYGAISKRFPDNALDRMLSGIGGLACSPENADKVSVEEIISFIQENVRGGRRRLAGQNLERLIVNRTLSAHLSDKMATYLTE